VLRPMNTYFSVQDQVNEATALRTLNIFAVDLITIPSVEDLFWYVAQNVVGKLHFVDCVIYQANEAQTELTQVAAWGEKNPYGREILNPMIIPFGHGITGQVAQTQSAIIIKDLLKDQNYIPDTQPARSEICVPLIFRGRVVGVIDSESPEPQAFGEAELEILRTVAAMTSAKLELLAETQRSKQRYQDLLVSHAQLTQETNNRKALEAKLFEARKLEAIGRLTGRFAHEFNNLLTVISGNLEFLECAATTAETADILRDAQDAANRGAKLIRDMLTFAQRTRLEPAVLDINRCITTLCRQHTAILGNAPDLSLASDLWPVLIDPKGFDAALLNLALNAQDAMPEGGLLSIKTENYVHSLVASAPAAPDLLPGRYVCVSLTDQGVGIASDRLGQIFDPFFTSKSVGTGAGLGLSMVKGFIQQSGGAVTVASDLGRGTTVQLFIPIAPSLVNELLTLGA
jgi:signal transduction histidine kinase